MPKGQNINNYEYLFSLSDADFVGAPGLCEDDVFKFDVYAPTIAGGGKQVGGPDNGHGKFDAIFTFPGLHANVFISRDGGAFEPIGTWNLSGPTFLAINEDENWEWTYNGHQLISDPRQGGTSETFFIKKTVGHWTYVSDPDNNEAIQDLSGSGQSMDLMETFC